MVGPQNDDPDAFTRDLLLVATAGASLLNAMPASPVYAYANLLLRPVLASFYISSELVMLYLASIMCGLVTLMLAGIPAALFERATGRTRSDTASIGIWLAATVLLVLPALMAMR